MKYFFLVLYYAIGFYLPDSFSKPFGKVSNSFRRTCVKHIFKNVGKNINIGRKAYFGKGFNIEIGDNSNIGNYCHVPSNIKIGKNVMMGPNNYFFESVTHKFDRTDIPMILQGVHPVEGRIEIGNDVWIGRNCHILPCKKIGSHTILGACSVVTKDIEDWTIVAGNPAKLIRKRK